MSELFKLFLIGAGYGLACLLGHEYRQWKRQRNLTAAIERQRIEDRRNAAMCSFEFVGVECVKDQQQDDAETEWIPESIEI